VALVITSLVVIESQMEKILTSTSTKFINMGKVPLTQMEEMIALEKPSVLLTNIETLELEEAQAALLSVHLVYVAIDEVQVGTTYNLNTLST
jgi:hypothetical protein